MLKLWPFWTRLGPAGRFGPGSVPLAVLDPARSRWPFWTRLGPAGRFGPGSVPLAVLDPARSRWPFWTRLGPAGRFGPGSVPLAVLDPARSRWTSADRFGSPQSRGPRFIAVLIWLRVRSPALVISGKIKRSPRPSPSPGSSRRYFATFLQRPRGIRNWILAVRDRPSDSRVFATEGFPRRSPG